MKKKSLFLPLFAAMALTGCSSEDPDINGGGSTGAAERYLAVSIVSTDAGGTRSSYDNGGSYEYEDGSEEENKVNSLRVYFFNSAGQPVNVKGREDNGNFYDVPTSEINKTGAEHGETVEQKIDAVLIVNTGEQVPSQIVAVLNHNLPDGPLNIANLRRVVGDYASLANEKKQFVMTNSVYLEGGQAVASQVVMSTNYAMSVEDAKKNPVTIYVERNVAKVRVKSSINGGETMADGSIMYPVIDKDTKEQYTISRTKEDGTQEDVAVYVKFYGWDVTGDLKYAYLSKNIRPGWKENVLGAGNWNDAAHHRSYWAGVCDGGTETETNVNQYFSYANPANFKFNKFDGSEWKYCNENGEKKKTNGQFFNDTDVIIKGELCDHDGNPLTFCEFAGVRIIDSNAFEGLKDRFLLMLKSARAHSHWKLIKNDDGSTTCKEISAEDITFITANESLNLGKSDKSVVNSGSYYVYACLTDAAAAAEWYKEVSLADGSTDDNPIYEVVPGSKIPATEVNAHLLDMSHAKIWNSGKTYYFAEIVHSYNTNPNTTGVVRNHIYDINLKNVYGIGTPVYDPEEVIIPEKPGSDDSFIAAEIKILSWRLITNNVDLEWD